MSVKSNVITAIKRGSVSEVRKALRSDRDNASTAKDDEEKTPLHHAAEEGNVQIVKALLAKKVLPQTSYIFNRLNFVSHKLSGGRQRP
jgi:ankyrin repeat protein